MNLFNLAIATATIGCLLHAQTYIVDASNGPSTNFTDLPAAIAAVPNGATLHVKPGSYSEFTISGKSLTLLAETVGTVTVTVNAACMITGLATGQRVCVSGFAFAAGYLTYGTAVWVTSCAGSVVMDQISLPPLGNPPVVIIDQSSDVHLLRWVAPAVLTTGISEQWILNRFMVTRSNVEIAASTLAGGAPTLLVQAPSVVTVSETTVTGGRGSDAIPNVRPGSSGYDAIQVLGPATMHLFGSCTVKGGAGGFQFSTLPIPCNGGNGLVLSNTTARAFGAVLAGGAIGGGPTPQPGQPFVLLASTLEQKPQNGASAFLSGTMAPGQLVKLSVRAAPGAPATLLLGTASTFALAYPIALGAFCVRPLLVLDALTVPATGLLEVPVQLPLNWPRDQVVLAQFLTIDPTLSEVQASSSFAAITR